MNELELTALYQKNRARSEEICKHLEIEDYVVQPMVDVSPPKWHLAHCTWFFEQFILKKTLQDYKSFNEDFSFLFNSYYNHLGERTPRPARGLMTRPTVKQVYQYRHAVDAEMIRLLQNPLPSEALELIEIGLNHEQQHQELLIYDIKYILGTQPTYPSLGPIFDVPAESQKQQWLHIEGGSYDVGASESGFCYDNEQPTHQQHIPPFSISNKLVTNGEYLEFMEAGGYECFEHWLDEGWHLIKTNNWKYPLYWHKENGEWYHYSFSGLVKVERDEPIAHLSFHEAFAYADWRGLRLPTEFEWEVAADRFAWGKLWEWTYSAYLPYPGFRKSEGALGEYNGKFMINQNVLRGGSVATPEGHSRKTYRNFFPASSRWIFSGVRLAQK